MQTTAGHIQCMTHTGVPFTTISLIDLSIGPFTGGNLRYWAEDSQKGARSSRVEEVRGEPSLALNIMRGTVFDGNSDNEVEPFKGERYSLIFGDEAGCAAIFEVRTVQHHLVARRHVRNDEYLIRISDFTLRFRTRAVQETDRQTC